MYSPDDESQYLSSPLRRALPIPSQPYAQLSSEHDTDSFQQTPLYLQTDSSIPDSSEPYDQYSSNSHVTLHMPASNPLDEIAQRWPGEYDEKDAIADDGYYYYDDVDVDDYARPQYNVAPSNNGNSNKYSRNYQERDIAPRVSHRVANSLSSRSDSFMSRSDVDYDEKPRMHYGPAPDKIERRNKTVRTVKLTQGHLVSILL